jgi:hypothetical protein
VVEPDDATPTGYRLTADFAAHVEDHVGDLDSESVDADAVAPLFDADPTDVSEKDREYPAYEVGIRVRKWPSEVAFLADVAADRALAAWTDRWRAVPTEQRVEILSLLRASRTTCPACGGTPEETGETVDSCCVSVKKYAYRCQECGTHLREHDRPIEPATKGMVE